MNMDPQFGLYLASARPILDLDALCSEEERALGEVLRWGRARARQVPDIAADAGLPPRRAQELVEHLIHEHHWPIGTSMSRPFGNYLIDCAEDLEETVALLRRRGISTLARAAALKRMTVEQYLRYVQNELQLGRTTCS